MHGGYLYEYHDFRGTVYLHHCVPPAQHKLLAQVILTKPVALVTWCDEVQPTPSLGPAAELLFQQSLAKRPTK